MSEHNMSKSLILVALALIVACAAFAGPSSDLPQGAAPAPNAARAAAQ